MGAPTRTRLVAGKDIYMLVVIGLMLGVTILRSPRLRDRVAGALATLALWLSGAKRRGTEATLQRVFGYRMGARRRRAIVRGAFRAFWLDTFTLLPATEGARLVGGEHLRRALNEGRGAIVWISNNYAGASMLKSTLHAHGFPVHKVHAANHLGGFRTEDEPCTWLQRRVIRPLLEWHERRVVAGFIHVTPDSLAYVRQLTSCLKRNGIVCISADARLGRRFVGLPFLGLAEAFPTGTVSLAATSGAPLLPAFCHRRRVVIEPPLGVPARLDRQRGVREVLARWVARLEHHTRRHPSRYFNWHLVGIGLPPIESP
jgi:lauroyl/myristoyl acyltransferase